MSWRFTSCCSAKHERPGLAVIIIINLNSSFTFEYGTVQSDQKGKSRKKMANHQ